MTTIVTQNMDGWTDGKKNNNQQLTETVAAVAAATVIKKIYFKLCDTSYPGKEKRKKSALLSTCSTFFINATPTIINMQSVGSLRSSVYVWMF